MHMNFNKICFNFVSAMKKTCASHIFKEYMSLLYKRFKKFPPRLQPSLKKNFIRMGKMNNQEENGL
jgi:hypothetical protein